MIVECGVLKKNRQMERIAPRMTPVAKAKWGYPVGSDIHNGPSACLYWWGPAFKDLRVIFVVGGGYIRKVY